MPVEYVASVDSEKLFGEADYGDDTPLDEEGDPGEEVVPSPGDLFMENLRLQAIHQRTPQPASEPVTISYLKAKWPELPSVVAEMATDAPRWGPQPEPISPDDIEAHVYSLALEIATADGTLEEIRMPCSQERILLMGKIIERVKEGRALAAAS
jgi:hypothetical protein